MIAIREAISPNWAESLAAGKVCFGLDVASTEGKKSNPSSLTATEYWDRIYWQRLVVRWKTEHYAVMLGILELVIGAVPREQRGVLVVDTSNEKFLARGLAKDLSAWSGWWGFTGSRLSATAAKNPTPRRQWGPRIAPPWKTLSLPCLRANGWKRTTAW